MDYLEEIALSEVRSINAWHKEKNGALLQISVGGKPTVGVRCNFKVADGEVDSVVIVSGQNVGRLVTANLSQSEPGLDVTDLLEIVAVKPMPLSPPLPPPPLKPGMLFQYDKGYFLWFTLLEGSGSGFICIANSDPRLVGQSQSSLSEDRLFIAPTISVQRRQNPN